MQLELVRQQAYGKDVEKIQPWFVIIEKYQSVTISAVEQAYLETLGKVEKKLKKARKSS